MSCDCHISERCGARQALSILEPHLASIFSHSLCMLPSTLFLMSLRVGW